MQRFGFWKSSYHTTSSANELQKGILLNMGRQKYFRSFTQYQQQFFYLRHKLVLLFLDLFAASCEFFFRENNMSDDLFLVSFSYAVIGILRGVTHFFFGPKTKVLVGLNGTKWMVISNRLSKKKLEAERTLLGVQCLLFPSNYSIYSQRVRYPSEPLVTQFTKCEPFQISVFCKQLGYTAQQKYFPTVM